MYYIKRYFFQQLAKSKSLTFILHKIWIGYQYIRSNYLYFLFFKLKIKINSLSDRAQDKWIINVLDKNLNSIIPIVVKISPDISDNEIEKISEVLINNEVEAMIISNTSDATREKLIDIQKHQKGGLSGKPIEDKSNLLINKFYKLIKNKIKIIGVGGIDSGQSAYNKFLAGADYIQLYTGMVFKGPNIANIIKNELCRLLLKEGVKNFTEIIGNKSK